MNRASPIALALWSAVILGCGGRESPAPTAPVAQPQNALVDQRRGNRPEAATGSGHWTINGELRTFAFHAIRKADGTATGTFELHNRALDSRLHGTVTCLTTFANEAWFGGVIENSTGSLGEVIWRVKDNGEGEGAAPDQVSLVFNNPNLPIAERYCLIRPLTPLNNIESGNVQVHPTADLSGPFTGTWSGSRFTPDGRLCCAFRWDIQQVENTISGLLFAPHGGCINLGGCPVSGTVEGTTFTFEVEFPFNPAFIERGTAVINGNVITGTVLQCSAGGFCGPPLPFRVTRQ